jgi:hydroxymethylbilane synthase
MIRIGTRESKLALFQAKLVQQRLLELSVESEIIEIKSDGDVDLKTPLYEMGIQGIFTKLLDLALLDNKVDLAVHSAKDVPTRLAKGLVMPAMLKRGSHFDALVYPSNREKKAFGLIDKLASSSLRRRCQWNFKFPATIMENLRGNVHTRLAKLDASDWDGAIFAHAALERLLINSHQFEILDWMLPAPAQGGIGIVCRREDEAALELLSRINDEITKLCVTMERDFMAALQGGCSIPVAALARPVKDGIHFKGNLFSLDASRFVEVDRIFSAGDFENAGKAAADDLLDNGGLEIIQSFRTSFQ